MQLMRALEGPLLSSGRWGAWSEALRFGEQAAVAGGDKAACGWVLHQRGTYEDAISALNGFGEFRGTGTKTALLATFVAHIFAEEPTEGLRQCANALGSDTDINYMMALRKPA